MHGIHHELTSVAASQLAFTLIKLERYTEVKALTIPYIKTTRDTSFRIAYARALYKKLQEAFREHAAKQKQTLKGAFAADHAITADDRVDLEPDRLPIDEDPSDGA